MALVPDDAVFVIMSDHGFDFRMYEHDNGPPGVLIVGGPGIRPGQFENASVYDVAPTLLRLMDLPVAEDMQGKPLEIGLPGSVLSHEPVRVATHGAAAESLSPEQVSKEELDRLKEQLRALGYVN
jgi:arylsulfatase A-like enzyme